MSFNEKLTAILGDLHDTLVRKNADYGDSYARSVKKHGQAVTVIRLEDKLNRLDSLLKQDQQVKDESVEDTLLDIAGYAVLELIRRK
jgi:hypothetical protein